MGHNKMGKNNELRQNGYKLLAIACSVAPIILAFVFITRFAVNVPFNDQWRFVRELSAFRSGDLTWIALLWEQEHMHRQFVPRLIALGMAAITDWNIKVEIYFGFLLQLALLYVWWRIYKEFFGDAVWGFVPIAWLIFSLGHWENMLWGWQTAVFLMVLMVTLALYLLALPQNHVALAVCCGAIGSFSFGNGLMIWPIGLLLLLLQKRPRRDVFLWLVAAVVVAFVYFFQFETDFSVRAPQSGLSVLLNAPLIFFIFFLRAIALPLSAFHLTVAAVSGVLLLGVLTFMVGRMVKEKQLFATDNLLLLSFVLFGLGSGLLITAGRVGYGTPVWAIGSRYLISVWLLVGAVYLFYLKRRNGGQLNRLILAVLLTLMTISLSIMSVAGWQRGEQRHIQMRFSQAALQHYQVQPLIAFQNLSPFPTVVQDNAPYLEAEQLTAFAETPTLLPLTINGEGVPFGEIVPSRPVEMAFVCPVETLHDVGILFANYGRSQTPPVQITIQQEDTTLFTTQLDTSQMPDNTMQTFQLEQPIGDCYKRPLLLTIHAPQASSGNAVTVWTYPAYYQAEIIGRDSLANRVIGLQLNGCRITEAAC